MITSRDYWRVMNGGYLDNPHFLLPQTSVVRCQLSVVIDSVVISFRLNMASKD